ncbi:hypothetical protein [Terasakiispira papahanaumokuakeensis]|nr:hypothetical protein [Terasakiispira papahanaumokuakeensis]
MTNMFEDWKKKENHQGQLFITDGVIDQDLWRSSNSKVMFLLKEAYDSKRHSGTWDLPELIKRRGVSGRTFKPMAQWAYGVQNLLKGKGIAPYVDNSSDVKQSLLSSSVVNIKKSSGKKASSNTDLLNYVNEDWNLLYSQIKAISPRVVVCGKTWSLIANKLKNKKKITDRAYVSENIIYINFWHPSNRSSNLMSYYALCAITEMALNEASKYDL